MMRNNRKRKEREKHQTDTTRARNKATKQDRETGTTTAGGPGTIVVGSQVHQVHKCAYHPCEDRRGDKGNPHGVEGQSPHAGPKPLVPCLMNRAHAPLPATGGTEHKPLRPT